MVSAERKARASGSVCRRVRRVCECVCECVCQPVIPGVWFWRDLLAVEAKELEDPIENNRFLHLKEDPQSHVWLEPLFL